MEEVDFSFFPSNLGEERAKRWRGRAPSWFSPNILAPFLTRISMISINPSLAATWRGVFMSPSVVCVFE